MRVKRKAHSNNTRGVVYKNEFLSITFPSLPSSRHRFVCDRAMERPASLLARFELRRHLRRRWPDLSFLAVRCRGTRRGGRARTRARSLRGRGQSCPWMAAARAVWLPSPRVTFRSCRPSSAERRSSVLYTPTMGVLWVSWKNSYSVKEYLIMKGAETYKQR